MAVMEGDRGCEDARHDGRIRAGTGRLMRNAGWALTPDLPPDITIGNIL